MTAAWDAQRYDRSFAYVSRFGRDVVDLLAPAAGERVLDLGCGTGDLTAELAARGIDVVGIDADPAMITTARARHPQVSFEQADAHTFTLAAPVDAVLSNAALHWMRRPSAVIDRVRAALRPGGRFVGEFGGHGNIATIHAAVVESTQQVGLDIGRLDDPWYFPTPAAYASLLESGGFRVRLLEHFDRPTPLTDGEDGLAEWLRQFASGLLGALTVDEREAVIRATVSRCRPALHRDGRWVADYVRLRFHAELTS